MSETCPECGFDFATETAEGLRIISRLPEDAGGIAESMGDAVYRRPEEGVWSANEYVWHLADTLRLSAEWLHDMRVREHPTHYAVDNDAMAAVRGYNKLPVALGLWSLAEASPLFIDQAVRCDPTRTCYYSEWRDVTAAEVVSFLTHEAVHHIHDLTRMSAVLGAGYAG